MIMFGKRGQETAHHNNMHYKNATLCYDPKAEKYILPGSGKVKGEKRNIAGKLEGYTQHAPIHATEEQAKHYIVRLNALMS